MEIQRFCCRRWRSSSGSYFLRWRPDGNSHPGGSDTTTGSPDANLSMRTRSSAPQVLRIRRISASSRAGSRRGETWSGVSRYMIRQPDSPWMTRLWTLLWFPLKMARHSRLPMVVIPDNRECPGLTTSGQPPGLSRRVILPGVFRIRLRRRVQTGGRVPSASLTSHHHY